MAEAAILSLESYRQEALEQKFRERIHKEVDKWLTFWRMLWMIERSHQAYGV